MSLARRGSYETWDALPAVPGLKLRLPLIIGYVITVGVHFVNSEGFTGKPTDAQIFAENKTAMTPAPWCFYVWGVIYAYQGLGALYAMVPNGYGSDGNKEQLVRIAGACWPFGWTCEIVWQVCFEKQRMIAAAVFLQGAFAGFAIAMSKLFTLGTEKASPIQRWSYVASTHINCAWITSECFIFCFIVMEKRGIDAPAWIAVLLCLGLTAFALVILLLPMMLSPLEPPFTLFGVTIAWVLLAIAAAQSNLGLKAEPWITGFLACVVAAATVAVYVNAAYVRSKLPTTTSEERLPLFRPVSNMTQNAGSLDSFERVVSTQGGTLASMGSMSVGGAGRSSMSRDSSMTGIGGRTAKPYDHHSASEGSLARAVRGVEGDVPPHGNVPRPRKIRDGAPEAPITHRHMYPAEREWVTQVETDSARRAGIEWARARAEAEKAEREWQAAKAAADKAAADEAMALAAEDERRAAHRAAAQAAKEQERMQMEAAAAHQDWIEARAALAEAEDDGWEAVGVVEELRGDARAPSRSGSRGGIGRVSSRSRMQVQIQDEDQGFVSEDAATAEAEWRRARGAAKRAEEEWKAARQAAAEAAALASDAD